MTLVMTLIGTPNTPRKPSTQTAEIIAGRTAAIVGHMARKISRARNVAMNAPIMFICAVSRMSASMMPWRMAGMPATVIVKPDAMARSAAALSMAFTRPGSSS